MKGAARLRHALRLAALGPLATSPSPEGAALPGPAWLPAALLALTLLALALATFAFEARGARLPLALFLLIGGEAWGPGARRTARDGARQAAGLGLLGASAVVPGTPGALLLGAAALAALRAFQHVLAWSGAPPAISPRARRIVLGLFGAAVAANVLVVTAGRFLPERRVDLATLERRPLAGHDRLALLSRLTPFYVPEDALLVEDGVPLPFPESMHGAIAAVGSGRYAIQSGRAVHYSSTDGSDPLTSGRRYELIYQPQVFRSFPGELLFAAAVALGLLAWRLGALAPLAAPSSRRARLALVAGTVAALAAGLPRHWDDIAVVPDSPSYVVANPTRTPLYPRFIALLDREPAAPRVFVERTRSGTPPTSAQLRYLDVIRAQKLLTIGALAVLLWTLGAHASAWVLGALTWVTVLADQGAWLDESVASSLGVLQSEGLNQPLLFLFLAAALADFARPRWLTGIALALVLALLVLTRPTNTALAVVFAFVALRHARCSGLRAALVRTALLAAIFVTPLLLACAANQQRYGRFRLHAFTGQNVFGTAFQTATPEDVDAFPEPVLREVCRVCVVELIGKRIPVAPGGDYVNVNAYEIGLPAVERVVPTPPGEHPNFVADDVLLAIGKRLIARHPRAFLDVVRFNASQGYDVAVHGALALAALVALALFWRAREGTLLFAAFAASLPLVALLPTCVFNFPLGRYRGPLEPLELAAIPLLLTLVAASRGGLRERAKTDRASVTNEP